MSTATGKRVWRRACVLGGAIVLLAAVAACASSSPAVQPGGRPTGGGQTGGTGAMPKASCGTAITHGLNTDTQMLLSDKGALTCFHTAATKCSAASLAVTEMGVDGGTADVLVIDASGASESDCQVTWWHRDYSANGGGSTGTVDSASCRLGAVTSASVTVSCADRTMLIPATVVAVR
jgi:hypothetical protein